MTDNYKKDTQANPHKITLNLTQSDKIIISFKDPLNLIGNNYIEPILFSHNDDLILLTKENIYHLLLELSNSLKKALKNKLPFDDFVTPDIGLAFNQHYCYEPTSYYERLQTKAPTKIKPYALWEKNYEKSKYKIWIYNNCNNDIVFTITPIYPFFTPNRNTTDFIPYDEWMLDYKPYFTAKIPHEMAQEWLNKIQNITSTMDSNTTIWNNSNINPYKIDFSIDKANQLIIDLQCPLAFAGFIHFTPIIFSHLNQQICLTKDTLYHNMYRLKELLEKALKNELELDERITNDIGYLYNFHLKGNSRFSIIKNLIRDKFYWDGDNYSLWQSNSNLKEYHSWLYNENDNIIFKVTPSYGSYAFKAIPHSHYVPFKKWILNYKPYCSVTLSKEIAQQLIELANFIMETISNNDSRWKEEREKEV